MRLVTYRSEAGERAGFMIDGVVVDGEAAARAAGLGEELLPAARSVRSMLAQMWERIDHLAGAASDQAAAGNGIGSAPLAAPVPDPGKILCLGLNYRLHADEFGDAPSEVPNVFAKFANSLIGPVDTIAIPSAVTETDFEGELAVVIARRCRHVSVEDAMDYVAGATAFNDVTARDLQRRTSQWTAGKAIDTFAPCGPALVSLDETGELGELGLRTTLNGEVMQEARLSQMIHSVPQAISFLSEVMTLMPGDIIATGTPHGVGARREPPVFMQPGDVIEVEIDRVGTLTNEVAAEDGLVQAVALPRASAGDRVDLDLRARDRKL